MPRIFYFEKTKDYGLGTTERQLIFAFLLASRLSNFQNFVFECFKE